MEQRKKGSAIATCLSLIYVAVAVALLLGVCGYCYPEFAQKARQVIGGWEDGAVQQAFGTLADGLEAGRPVKETLSDAAEVFFHAAS